MKKLLPLCWLCLLASGPLWAQTLLPSSFETNGTVNTIQRAGDTVYVGGSFSTIGYNTSSVARLPGGGSLPDQNFPRSNGAINAWAADGAGGYYVGGGFTQIGGQNRLYVAHILADKTVDAAFNPGTNSLVNALALSGNLLYVGGYFTQIGDQPRTFLAALNATTGTPTAWNPSPD
ncbi:MAG: hypothetical protein H7Z75_02030, partial [Ferruginibacter sp.]|nr:hypothetical protein [Cytophagales bacterium]